VFVNCDDASCELIPHRLLLVFEKKLIYLSEVNLGKHVRITTPLAVQILHKNYSLHSQYIYVI
jgi:hypothetical protein